MAMTEEMVMGEATAKDFDTWLWGRDGTAPRFLHTMIRVKDFDASLRFYLEGLGMRVLDRFDVESRRASAVYIGYNDYAAGGLVELTSYWDEPPQPGGAPNFHIAIGVPDVPAMVEKLEALGAEVSLRPKVLMEGGPEVAFVKDPDGYSVELIQTRKS